jgi:hypothetical protein
VRFELGDGDIVYPESMFRQYPILDTSGPRALIDLGSGEPVYVIELIDASVCIPKPNPDSTKVEMDVSAMRDTDCDGNHTLFDVDA